MDWGSTVLSTPMYVVFLGTQHSNNTAKKPEMKKSPASTRIRLKLLHYLNRVTSEGFIIPPTIQVSLGSSTSRFIKSILF